MPVIVGLIYPEGGKAPTRDLIGPIWDKLMNFPGKCLDLSKDERRFRMRANKHTSNVYIFIIAPRSFVVDDADIVVVAKQALPQQTTLAICETAVAAAGARHDTDGEKRLKEVAEVISCAMEKVGRAEARQGNWIIP